MAQPLKVGPSWMLGAVSKRRTLTWPISHGSWRRPTPAKGTGHVRQSFFAVEKGGFHGKIE